jgi:hypothetical protein
MKVQNNIIYGNLDDEFFINNDANGIPISNPILENCLIKTKNASLNTNGNVLNIDPKFINVSKADFDLQANSPCRNAGTNVGIILDLKNRNRNTASPSIGAYEVQ